MRGHFRQNRERRQATWLPWAVFRTAMTNGDMALAGDMAVI
jgi:hypothetical protein